MENERAASRNTVVVLGPLPPPLTGASKNTAIIADKMKYLGAKIILLPTNPNKSTAHSHNLVHLARKVGVSANTFVSLILSTRRGRIAYVVPDGGLGIWATVIFSATLRILGASRVFIHYRNSSLTNADLLSVRLILGILGRRAHHIFLSESMKRDFVRNHAEVDNYTVLPNTATSDLIPSTITKATTPANHIGFISNLSLEKGFDVAIETFIKLAKTSPKLIFSVAGKPVDRAAVELLLQAERELGSRFLYWGEIGGATKKRFFDDIDILFFPSRYKLEAQPNVIYEAMAAGVSVVASRHAYIPEMLTGAPHRLINLSADAASRAKEVIMEEIEVLANPDVRRTRRLQIVSQFSKVYDESHETLKHLLFQITNRQDG